jgi:hypothetical protein
MVLVRGVVTTASLLGAPVMAVWQRQHRAAVTNSSHARSSSSRSSWLGFSARCEPQDGSGAKLLLLLLLHNQPAAAVQVMRKQQQVQVMHADVSGAKLLLLLQDQLAAAVRVVHKLQQVQMMHTQQQVGVMHGMPKTRLSQVLLRVQHQSRRP